MARATLRTSRTGGFTLVEMIVVLAVLALLATLTLPMLRTSLRDSRLREAGRVLRAELTRARLRAIETGIPQQFRFRPGTRRFEVAARTPSAAGIGRTFSASGTRRLGANPDRPGAGKPSQHELPEGVVFYDQQTAAVPSAQPGGLAPLDGGRWSPSIVFYPNGRTANARIRLRGRSDTYVDVVVRGATGSTTIGRVMRSEANTEDQAGGRQP
jgi:type II secretion system protein H